MVSPVGPRPETEAQDDSMSRPRFDFVIVLALKLVGDTLHDLLDPRTYSR